MSACLCFGQSPQVPVIVNTFEREFQFITSTSSPHHHHHHLKEMTRSSKVSRRSTRLAVVHGCSLLTIGAVLLSTKMTMVSGNSPGGSHLVTCGSLLKLMNANSGVRLHSHDVKYGSGSGQQSVTGTDKQEDINSYWQVRAKTEQQCERGTPIACGSNLRLTHLQTGRNLHSHHFSSPLSGQQEVSAFGAGGEGDTGDNWTVLCGGAHWELNSKVRLKHLDTEAFLAVSGHTYGRPIHGQMEIIATSYSDGASYWIAKEGVYVKPNENGKFLNGNAGGDAGHDEL